MNHRIKTAFLLMILLQAIHSVEEYIFKLYEVFPPMQLIYRNTPELAQAAFITFNLLLFLFGLICFFYWVQPARKRARVVVWIWIVIQMATVAAHLVWAIVIGGYNPGLATAPLFVPVIGCLLYWLQRVQCEPPSNKSLDVAQKSDFLKNTAS
ncbi:MAG: HXXEE domain-containing protein [Acidobacteriota bacterium]|nr:HXXEE domain-containing protein [Acidobacteriota bacterium]